MSNKTMKVYKVYLEDVVADRCYKSLVLAFNEEHVCDLVSGKGEVIAIKEADVSSINASFFKLALSSGGFVQAEIDILALALDAIGLIQ